MVLYEVSVRIDRAVADAYLAWLPGHVQRMLALPGFESAEMFEVVETPPDAGLVQACVHYRLADAGALERYLQDHAARMRAEGTELFGNRIRAARRVLRPLPG